MKLNSVRLLVNDYTSCFRFYKNKLELPCTWGNENSLYASFMVGQDAGIALFRADQMKGILNSSQLLSSSLTGDKSMVIIEVQNVDDVYKRLKTNGVNFINEPSDYREWTIRAVHLRDPEGNLIELFTGLTIDKWSPDLTEEYYAYHPEEIKKERMKGIFKWLYSRYI